MDALVFIDTNIFLDFYRARGAESGLKLLTHIEGNHDRIITTTQVEMEYKKNRQDVILESLKAIKPPDVQVSVPSFLSQSKPTRSFDKGRKELQNQVRRMRARTEAVLRDPAKNDTVFRVAQALFKNGSPLNLSRDRDERSAIRRLAWKRFILGYPPRKDRDTSTGDSINWEWMLRCAKDFKKDLIIVSRDSDYGRKHLDEPILNDWLLQEFKERVGARRKVLLTDRLSEAFRRISVPITTEEEAGERELIAESSSASSARTRPWDEILRSLTPEEVAVMQLIAIRPPGSAVPSLEEIASQTNSTVPDVVERLNAISAKIDALD